MEALRALIAHCKSPEAGGYTPSDFPEATVSRQSLNRLLKGIRNDFPTAGRRGRVGKV